MNAKPIVPGCRFMVTSAHPVPHVRGEFGIAVQRIGEGIGLIVCHAAVLMASDLWEVEFPSRGTPPEGCYWVSREAWMMRIDPDAADLESFKREAAPPIERRQPEKAGAS